MRPKGTQKSPWSGKTFTSVVGATTLGLVICTLFAGRDLFLTPLGPIDDHELVQWQLENPSGELPYSLVAGFRRTFGEFNSPRFRPFFHPLRAVMTALFGPDPTPHYALRILVSSITVLATSLILINIANALFRNHRLTRAYFPLGTASILFVYEWQDLTARIGTQEPFGLLGLSLAGLAVSARRRSSTGLLLTGVVLMVGFKENFSALALLTCIIYALLERKRALTIAPILSFVTASFGILMVGLSLLSTGGRDYYGKERNPTTFVGDTIAGLLSPRVLAGVFLLIALGMLIPACLRGKYRPVAVLVLLGMVSESTFYGNEIDIFGRYACVSNLMIIVMMNLALIALLNWWHLRKDLSTRSPMRLFLHITLATASVILFLTSLLGIREVSANAKFAGEHWQGSVGKVTREIERGGYTQILVILDVSRSEHLMRWERSHALIISLRQKFDPDVRVFFALDRLRAPSEEAAKVLPIRTGLATHSLEGFTSNGFGGTQITWVSPLNERADNEPLYCIHYSVSGVRSIFADDCTRTARFSPSE